MRASLQVPTKRWRKRAPVDELGFIPNVVRSLVSAGKRITPQSLKYMYDNAARLGKVFPGSKYIGPGNPMNLGEPTSDGDALAYMHDMAYDRLLKAGVPPAQVYLGLTQADDDAINAAKSVLSTHKDNGAVAVLMGLSAKRGASRFMKEVYEKLPESLQKTLPMSTWKEFYPDPLANPLN